MIELLVVVLIITVLVMTVLPAIQAARESGRCSACQNNLRQVGIALGNYTTVYGTLPVGARCNRGIGISWWVGIATYLGEAEAIDQFDMKGADNGFALVHHKNGALVDRLLISSMLCPSSPLEHSLSVGSFTIMMPSYVGISGASSHDGFQEVRVTECCVPKIDGEVSAGGLLIPNQPIRFARINDGSSKTLIAAECSDYAYASDGARIRIDGGYRLGWIVGTGVKGTPPNYAKPSSAWNLTTIRYPPNTQQYELPGVYVDHGPNNPLTSAHYGGVNVLSADGSVKLTANGIDLHTLKMLATRDDGGLRQ